MSRSNASGNRRKSGFGCLISCIIAVIVLAVLIVVWYFIVFHGKDESAETSPTVENTVSESVSESDPDGDPDDDPDGDPDGEFPYTERPGDYLYRQLNKTEKFFYRAVYNTVKSGEHELNISISEDEYEVYKESQDRIFDAVAFDHPELFGFKRTAAATATVYQNDVTLKIEPEYEDFIKDKESEEKMRSELSEAVSAVAEYARKMGDDTFSIVKAVYDAVIELASYDYEGLEICEDNDDAGEERIIYSAYGTLVKGRAVCSGYSAAVKIILDELDIPCTVVNSSDHSWNVVWIDGVPTNIDACWDDSSSIDEAGNPEDDGFVKYDYFGLTSEQILKIDKHIPDTEFFDPPECVSEEYRYHVHEGYYLDTYSFEELSEIFEKQKEAGADTYTVFIRDPEEFSRAEKELIENKDVWKLSVFDPFPEGKTLQYYFDDDILIAIFYTADK